MPGLSFDNATDTAYLLKVGRKNKVMMMKMENGKEDEYLKKMKTAIR